MDTPHPLMNPVLFWQVTSFGVTAVALLGIVLSVTQNEGLLGTLIMFD